MTDKLERSEQPGHITTGDVRHCIEGTCRCTEVADLRRQLAEKDEEDDTVALTVAVAKLRKELADSRITNRELNRRCQSLQKVINEGSGRKAWYGYFQAALSLFGSECKRAEAAERTIAEIRKLAKENEWDEDGDCTYYLCLGEGKHNHLCLHARILALCEKKEGS